MHTPLPVDDQWDPVKAAANVKKRDVRFADAALSLEDPLGRSIADTSRKAARAERRAYEANI